MISKLAARTSPGEAEIPIFRPQPRTSDSETVGVRSRNLYFHELSKRFRCTLKFEDLWSNSIPHKKEKFDTCAKKSRTKHKKSST